VTLSPERLIGGVVSAAGGLGDTPTGGGGGNGSGKATVGRTASGLAGFGTAVHDGGLDAGIDAIGLGELRGRSAVEVIARIADHLAESAEGPQADVIAGALRDSVLECIALESGGTYEDLDANLQAFLESSGIEGLLEAFLSHFVFDRVWAWIESHSNEKSGSVAETQALASAVEAACRRHVTELLYELKAEGRMDGIGWFGQEGIQLGEGIIETLEFRLQALQEHT